MWAIEVNNQALEFDGSIPIVLNNPMFSDQISYSLQFTVKAASIKNRTIFGYINKPEIADNKSRELPCKITAGTIVFTGTLVVIFQSNDFACYFKQSGDFWSAIKDKNLKDLPWDKVTFEPGTGYAEIIDFVHQYQESFDYDFTFPVVVNNTITEKFPIVVPNSEFINVPANPTSVMCPVIPFLYLRTIFEAIFKKNGLAINKNAFTNSFLRKICIPNNYMINEFELDKTVVWSGYSFISHITNVQNPVVTTVNPHEVSNYGFVKIGNIPGMPIDNNIYQVEVIDTTSFKLLNADFSAYPEYIRNVYRIKYEINGVRTPTKGGINIAIEDPGRYIIIIPDKEITETGDFWFYLRSDDWNCKPGYLEIHDGNVYIYPEHPDSKPTDDNYDNHTYNNATLISMATVGGGAYFEGRLQIFPNLVNTFSGINQNNHVPNTTIKDFLDQSKWLLGLIYFVRSSGVDIKTFKEILSSFDFNDISTISQLLSDVENPGINGYLLQMQADDTDTFYKGKLPVQTLDPKYTIKDTVVQRFNVQDINNPVSFLPLDDETNDVRLVIYEHYNADTQVCNSFYVFNKSFIADSSWKFLCFNLLDQNNGNGDLKIQTKFSTLLHAASNPVGNPFKYFFTWYIDNNDPNINHNQVKDLFLQMDVNCRCKTFDNDVISGLKAIIYYGIQYSDKPTEHCNYPLGSRLVYSSNDIYNFNGDIVPDAEFALRWDGDHGLYEKVWKEYIDWQLNGRKDCIGLIQWPESLLADFDFPKKYRIRAIDYLVKDILFNLNFKTEEIEHVQTDLAKV